MIIKDRIYHHISVHSQKTGRWSYTDPPLATIPPDLRDIYIPDPGWPWLEFDWSQVEMRLQAATAGEWTLLDSLDKGEDVYILFAGHIFGFPPPPQKVNPIAAPENAQWLADRHWRKDDTGKYTKDDPRRHFAKTMGQRLLKGGKPEASGSIPGAKSLNLGKEDLVRAAHAWLAAHPRIAAYHRRLEGNVLRTRETRTWFGRRRRYLGDTKYVPNEALAHPDQAGTQDLANLVVVEIKHIYGPDVYYVRGMHDSQTWAIRAGQEEIVQGILRIAQQSRRINGRDVRFPVEAKALQWKETP